MNSTVSIFNAYLQVREQESEALHEGFIGTGGQVHHVRNELRTGTGQLRVFVHYHPSDGRQQSFQLPLGRFAAMIKLDSSA
jgi:hypothetical protein